MINFVQVDKLTIPGGSPGTEKCKRDIRDHIIPAIAGDLLTGGNANVQSIIDNYIDSTGKIIEVDQQILPMLDAIGYSKFLMEKALQNALVSRNENLANLTGTNADTIDDFFQFEYTDIAAYRKDVTTEPTFLYDTQIYAGSQRALDAADMIDRNKRVIAEEAVDLMVKCSAFKHYNFSVKGGKVHCEDDIVDILEAICHDLRFSSNSAVYDASILYLNSENGLKHVTDQPAETKFAMQMARDMTVLAIQNKLGFNPYPDTMTNEQRDPYYDNARGLGSVGNKYYDAGNEIHNNIRFIATTAVGRAITQYLSLIHI